MTVVAGSGIASIIPILLVLACPLMMIFMMRGMHGGHGHMHGSPSEKSSDHMSLDELKHERDKLNEQIAERAEAATTQRRESARG